MQQNSHKFQTSLEHILDRPMFVKHCTLYIKYQLMMNVLFVPRLTINEELEEFVLSSLLRCDCINSPSFSDPALLLLVSQSCTQKRPSVYFFRCASVNVSRVSLQQSLLIPDSDSGDTAVIVRAEPASLMTSLSTCLHISGRAHKR